MTSTPTLPCVFNHATLNTFVALSHNATPSAAPWPYISPEPAAKTSLTLKPWALFVEAMAKAEAMDAETLGVVIEALCEQIFGAKGPAAALVLLKCLVGITKHFLGICFFFAFFGCFGFKIFWGFYLNFNSFSFNFWFNFFKKYKNKWMILLREQIYLNSLDTRFFLFF